MSPETKNKDIRRIPAVDSKGLTNIHLWPTIIADNFYQLNIRMKGDCHEDNNSDGEHNRHHRHEGCLRAIF